MDARKDELSSRRFDPDFAPSPAPGRGYAAVDTKDPDVIKSRIDRTRAELDQTVDALQHKLSPDHLIDAFLGNFKGAAGRSRVVGAIRENPLPAALIGMGLTWLLIDQSGGTRRGRSPSGPPDEVGRGRDEDWLAPGAQYWEGDTTQDKGLIGRAKERIGDMTSGGSGPGIGRRIRAGAEEVIDRVRDTASDLTDRVSHASGSVRHGVEDASYRARHLMRDTGHRANEIGHDLRHQADRARQGFWNTYEQNPLIIGAGAVAIGLLLGLSAPTTRAENKVMGETSDEVSRRAKRLGREALNKGQEVAEKVIDTARAEARNADIRTGDLVDKAKQVVTSVASTAKAEVMKAGREVVGVEERGGGNPGSSSTGKGSDAQRVQGQQAKNEGLGGHDYPTNTGKPVI